MKTSPLFFLACAVLFAANPASAQDERSATSNETRLTAMEGEIRALNGNIEQIEFSLRRLEQNLAKMQNDVDARLTKLESTPSPAVAQPQPQSYQPPATPSASAPLPQTPIPADVNGTLGALKMQGGKVTGGVNKPESPPLPAVPPDYGLTAQEQYERAFNFLREADYPQAEVAFKGFIDKNPNDKLLDNAKYWYGETLYVRARYEDAAVAFADAYQQNPKGVKAPDSLLKLGMSLGALKKIPEACVTLSELKNRFSNVAPAIKSRADDERAKLKCPAR